MHSDAIEKLVRNWGNNDLHIVNLRIAHLERWLFKTYEPDKFHNGDFWLRLEKWLDNVHTDDEKQLLFRLIIELLYLGPIEFEELYRCAYQGPIARWLIDTCQIDVFAKNAQTLIQKAASETWFCPITDSFRINSFFHVNNLAAGANLRPDWHSLLKLADTDLLNKYCATKNIRRLVLLEDFVGSGTQSLQAVNFAATLAHGLEVLFVPLVICPDGISNARKLEATLCSQRSNCLRYEGVLELPPNAFLTASQSPYAEPNDFIDRLRSLILASYSTVSGGALPGLDKPYHPFGFPHNQPTGGLTVMYSNTPNNTLPLIHWCPAGNQWNPIFPRHSRF